MYFSLKHNKYLRDLKKNPEGRDKCMGNEKRKKKQSKTKLVALICSPLVANHYLIWGG